MAAGSSFPAFIRAESDGKGFADFVNQAENAMSRVERAFNKSSNEIAQVVQRAVSGASAGMAGLDLGVGEMRQARAEARFTAVALEEMARSAREIARLTGDTSSETKGYIRQLAAQRIEADRVAASANASVTAYERLQTAINATAGSNDALRRSYQELFAEQAKAANAEVVARQSQERINARVAPGLLRPAATSQGAGFEALAAEQGRMAAAEQEMARALQEGNRRIAERQAYLDSLRIAEAGAAEGARLLAAVHRDTALAIGRTSNSARESAQAFIEAERAQERMKQELAEFFATIDPAAAAQLRLNQTLAQAQRLYEAGAIDAAQYARAQQIATRQVVEGAGLQRQGMVQVGQQLQDITVGFASGQRAGTIFAQQLPQLALALQNMGAEAGGANTMLGRFSAFLAGPWGIALTVAIPLVALFGTRLFEAADASNQAEDAAKKLADQQADLANFFDLATGAIKEQNQALIQNAILARGDSIRSIRERQGDTASEIRDLVATSAQRRAAPAQMRPGETPLQFLNRTGGESSFELGAQNTDIVEAIRGARGNQNSIDRALAAIADSGSSNAATARQIISLRAQAVQDGRDLRDLMDEAESLASGRLAESQFERSSRRQRRGGGGRSRANAEFRMEEFAEDTRRRLADIGNSFNRVPPALAETERGLAQLNDMRSDIMFRARPSDRDGLIADLERVEQIVRGGIAEKFGEQMDVMAQDIDVQRLRTAGFDDQAEILSLQIDLMRQFGASSEQELITVLERNGVRREEYETMLEQHRVMQELVREQERMDRLSTSVRGQLREVDSIRGTIEQGIARLPDDARGALAGVVDGIRQQFNDLFARSITESLFGGAFGDLEAELRNSPRARADRAIEQSSDMASRALDNLAQQAIDTANALASTPEAANDNNKDIVVTGSRKFDSLNIFNRTFTRLFETFLGTGSPLAAALGNLSRTGLEGAAIGGSASSLLFGRRGSALGGQIGGAIGNFAGKEIGAQFGKALGGLGKMAGPLGAIAGGLLGSALGGLMKRPKIGVANIGFDAGGNLSVASFSGNSKQFQEQAGRGGNSVISSVERIAEALGGSIIAGAGAVSIGIRDGKYRVDPTGRGNTRTKRGAIDFGEDAEAAVRAATMDLIRDGVIGGIRATTGRILQAGKDLDQALQKALDFESVFSRLKAYRDPVGAALDTLDKEFVRLRKIFTEAAATTEEFAALEELYGIERAKAVKEAADRVTSSLRGLFDELTSGNDARSLRERLSFAQARFNPLAARVAAGDVSAYDEFATAARELLDIQRQISGSQSDYFNLLDQITALTKQRIEAEANVASISANRDSPFASSTTLNPSNDNAAVVGAIQSQTQALLTGLQELGNGITAAMIEQALRTAQPSPGFRTMPGV